MELERIADVLLPQISPLGVEIAIRVAAKYPAGTDEHVLAQTVLELSIAWDRADKAMRNVASSTNLPPQG